MSFPSPSFPPSPLLSPLFLLSSSTSFYSLYLIILVTVRHLSIQLLQLTQLQQKRMLVFNKSLVTVLTFISVMQQLVQLNIGEDKRLSILLQSFLIIGFIDF